MTVEPESTSFASQALCQKSRRITLRHKSYHAYPYLAPFQGSQMRNGLSRWGAPVRWTKECLAYVKALHSAIKVKLDRTAEARFRHRLECGLLYDRCWLPSAEIGSQVTTFVALRHIENQHAWSSTEFCKNYWLFPCFSFYCEGVMVLMT